MSCSKQTGQAISEIADLLCCPATHEQLQVQPNGNLTRNSEVEFSIPTVAGQPILVDFEDSILNRQSILASRAESLIPKRRSRRSWWKRLLLGRNRKSPVSASRMVADLRSGRSEPVVLIVGGGTISDGAQVLYDSEGIRIIAFDVYASSCTDFVADAHSIPISDGSVDAVWIEAVLEHVLSPHDVAEEIWRVLKPCGLVYAATPFLQPVHEQAYDFSRFTESGHRWLFRKFDCIESGVIAGPGTALYQQLRYTFGAVAGNRRLGSIISVPFFWLRFLDLLSDRQHASDAASGVYFLGRRSERPLPAAEMPQFFRGVSG